MTFIQGSAFENVVCKMVSILSQPQCVKSGFTRSLVQRFPFLDMQEACDCWSFFIAAGILSWPVTDGRVTTGIQGTRVKFSHQFYKIVGFIKS